jgi:hypothetical protein
MKTKYIIIPFVFPLIVLPGCKKDTTINLGKSTCYPAFLWCEAKQIYLEKEITLDFNDDSRADGSYANFEFTDINENPLNYDNIELYIGGKKVTGGFSVKASSTNPQKIELKIGFGDNAKEGIYDGLLRLRKHTLNQVNDIKLQQGEECNILKWEIEYWKEVNPLEKAIIYIFIFLILIAIIWFAILKSLFIKRFDSLNVIIKINNVIEAEVDLKPYRKVIIANKKHKEQSFLNRVLTGKILYLGCNNCPSPLIIEPYEKDQIKIEDPENKFGVYYPKIIGVYEQTEITTNEIEIKIIL